METEEYVEVVEKQDSNTQIEKLKTLFIVLASISGAALLIWTAGLAMFTVLLFVFVIMIIFTGGAKLSGSLFGVLLVDGLSIAGIVLSIIFLVKMAKLHINEEELTVTNKKWYSVYKFVPIIALVVCIILIPLI